MSRKTNAEILGEQIGIHEKLWEAGMLPALFQTVEYCHKAKIVIPEWATVAVLNVLQDIFHDRLPRGQSGMTGNTKATFQENYMHYCRWSAMRLAMRNNMVAELPKRGAPKKGAKEVRLEELQKEARCYLKAKSNSKRALAGGHDQIGRSYRKVEKSRKMGELTFAFDQLYFRWNNSAPNSPSKVVFLRLKMPYVDIRQTKPESINDQALALQ